MHAAGQLAEYLAKHQLKMTRERKAILERVLALRGHFGVDELHAHLGESGLSVSRATLYRTLPVLVEAGLVHKVEMERGQARYEAIFGRHHHDHMVCLGCGRIFEFESREIERLQEEICHRKHFTMTGHTHQIRGLCDACAQAGRGVGELTSRKRPARRTPTGRVAGRRPASGPSRS